MRAELNRSALSGLATVVLIGANVLVFVLFGGRTMAGALLPVVLYQAGWCFSESWVVQKYRPVPSRPNELDQPGIIPHAVGLCTLLIALESVRATVHSAPRSYQLIALALVIGGSGIALRLVCIARLGPSFRDAIDLLDDHQYVATGPYAFLRHPAELGFALAMSGFLLLSGSVIGTLLFVSILVPLILIRTRLENRMLGARQGNFCSPGRNGPIHSHRPVRSASSPAKNPILTNW